MTGNEKIPTKSQCEREERIAVVQLKAYWDCFPLPFVETQEGQTRADDIVEANAKQVEANANVERRDYLAALRDRIKIEGEAAEVKKRKLEPLNSGKSPRALNGEVEPAKKDFVHNRIQEEGQRPSFKRGIKLETLNAERPGSKFHKKEMQSILNLIETGRSR